MEEKNKQIQMLDLMQRPAFLAEGGIITHVNAAASRYLLQTGTALSSLVTTGAEELADFTQGLLHLTLQLDGFDFEATILRDGNQDIVLLENAGDASPLRALSLAALELRMPMANAAAITDRMLPLATENAEPKMQEYAAQFHRRMMQMQRIINNMSDCALFGEDSQQNMECVEITALLQEQLESAALALAQAGITLAYTLPDNRIYTMAYPQKLERAVYNLLSNAAKFSPSGSTIRVQLRHNGNRLALSVTDQGPGTESAGDIFTRYLRQPGLEDPRMGLGLGMVIIRAAAKLHGGAVLVDHPEGAGTRFTMTMAIRQQKASEVRCHPLRIDYAGEQDHCLLELSDVLPASLYAVENNP